MFEMFNRLVVLQLGDALGLDDAQVEDHVLADEKVRPSLAPAPNSIMHFGWLSGF